MITLQNRLGLYKAANSRIEAYKEKMNEIKDILKSAPSFEQTKSMLSEAGLDYRDFVKFYGNEKIHDGYYYAKDLKDRYTILWMYSDIFDN